MLIDYATITHPGKIRKNNEDAFLLRQVTLRQITVEQALVDDLREALDLVHPGLQTHTREIWGRFLRLFGGGAS
jgi:hypothetical protein